MRNLGREFSENKVCVKVKNVGEIDTLARVIGEWLFEDIHVVNSKLFHGVYTKWLNDGKDLSIGLVGNQVEVLASDYFKNKEYEQVGCEEFIQNLREN